MRPVEGGDGRQTHDAVWETELNETVNQLDRLMMMRENGIKYIRQKSQTCMAAVQSSVAAGNVQSERAGGEVPLLQRWSNEIAERTKRFQLGRRSSLE